VEKRLVEKLSYCIFAAREKKSTVLS